MPKRQGIIKGEKDDHNQTGRIGIQGRSSSRVMDQKKHIPNQGKLKLDASIADQYITAPNDLKLVNLAREETKRKIRVNLGKQLRHVRRNISTIEKMLDKVEPESSGLFTLNKRHQRIYWIVQQVIDQ